LKNPPTTEEAFVRLFSAYGSHEKVGDYKCPTCGKNSESIHVSVLTTLPEIVVFAFNVYGARTVHFTPSEFSIAGFNKSMLHYKKVAQVIQYGSLGGGHYICNCIRSNGVFSISDTSMRTIEGLTDDENTYLTFYHFTGTTQIDGEMPKVGSLQID